MQFIKALFLTALLFSSEIFSEENASLSNLSELKWENRLILVWADNHQTNYPKIFKQYEYEINDRDIYWFVLSEENISTNFPGKISADFAANMHKKYSPNKAKVYLIGKDGGVKERETELDLNDLFGAIDVMPMRQREMKR